MRGLLRIGLVLGLGLAAILPAAAAAAAPPATIGAPKRHMERIDAIAKALGITPQQALTAIHQGALKELARVSHMTPAQVQTKIKGLHLYRGTLNTGHMIGRAGLRVGIAAVASELQMTPEALRQSIRARSLKLPAGKTVAGLQQTAQSAAQGWLRSVAAKHPTLTPARQQEIGARVAAVVGELLTKATTPAGTAEMAPAS